MRLGPRFAVPLRAFLIRLAMLTLRRTVLPELLRFFRFTGPALGVLALLPALLRFRFFVPSDTFRSSYLAPDLLVYVLVSMAHLPSLWTHPPHPCARCSLISCSQLLSLGFQYRTDPPLLFCLLNSLFASSGLS